MAAKPITAEPFRAPLFLFLIPFGLGLIASPWLHLVGTLTAAFLVVLLLATLANTCSLPSKRRWHAHFFITIFCLGGLYGASYLHIPGTPTVDSLAPPREEWITIEPEQTFLSPPYSEQQVGIGKEIPGDSLLYYTAPGGSQTESLERGFAVRLFGVRRDLEYSIPNEGFRSYLESRGVVASIDSLIPAETEGVTHFYRAVFSTLLTESKAALAQGSSALDPSTRVYQALVLGQRTGLTREQKKAFRETGTAHLFAISGLHVGLVGGFLFGFFTLIRVGPKIQVIGVLSILLFYVILTGATPSAVRAFLMIAFLLGAKLFRRAYSPPSALAASALVVLLIDPEQLFTLGFQLSYSVVLAILVFGIPLTQSLLHRTDPEYWLPGQTGSPFHKTRRWFFASFSISCAAFLGSAPLVMDHFQILPLSSILLNLLLIFPATLVLLCGFISLLFGLLDVLWISSLLNNFAKLIIDAMTALVSGTAAVPLSSIPIQFQNSWAGPLGMFLFLAITFTVGSFREFNIRYILLPIAGVFVTVLLGMIP